MEWNQIVNGCVVNGVATLRCLPALFKNIINAALIFAGTVAVAFIIVAGYKLLTSAGDPKKVESAKSTITYAIIGLIIVLMSFFIINFISQVTGVNCIKMMGFTNCA